ncbi:MAG: hypothetical protein K6E37_07390 [Bacteroidales bacterium]|nr:hypothetical protein [Bacteroidales bacterium]
MRMTGGALSGMLKVIGLKQKKVAEINLDKSGLYIKDLEYRTYAFVIDGDIALETDK